MQPEHISIWNQAVGATVLFHDWKPIFENSRAEMKNWTRLDSVWFEYSVFDYTVGHYAKLCQSQIPRLEKLPPKT